MDRNRVEKLIADSPNKKAQLFYETADLIYIVEVDAVDGFYATRTNSSKQYELYLLYECEHDIYVRAGREICMDCGIDL